MVPLRLLVEGRDFQLAAGRWTQTVTLGADGALLIRPDRHILHIARGANANEAAAMEAALNDYLKISTGRQA